jgi:hypothetical protein
MRLRIEPQMEMGCKWDLEIQSEGWALSGLPRLNHPGSARTPSPVVDDAAANLNSIHFMAE